MFFDPVYWLVIGVGMILGLWAQAKVKGAFRKYGAIATRSHLTGAEVARRILQDHDIHDVKVEAVAGQLTDHYDPSSKTLRLSEPVYGSNSMAAFGVAAHEVGHAIQHARAYGPLKFRSAWVPMVGIGSNFGFILIIIALFMGGVQAGGFGMWAAYAGLALFSATTIFTLVTLPVEFDASARALKTLEAGGYVTAQERDGAKKVLDAAALTYVAAFVGSLLMLLYWANALGLFGGDD